MKPSKRINVIQISTDLWEALQRERPEHFQVIGRFRRVLNLAWGDRVLALTTPDVDIGPFHVMLPSLPSLPDRGTLDDAFPSHITLEDWTLDFSHAARWSPDVVWAYLTPTATQWQHLLMLLMTYTLPDYIVPLLETLREALQEEDITRLKRAAQALAGLGIGLTPTGDDVLAGVMLRLHLEGRAYLTPLLYEAAAPRTTRLSRAFLAAARDGRVNAAWMRLLHVLHEGTADELNDALRRVLAYGATSGVDMVLGFTRGVS